MISYRTMRFFNISEFETFKKRHYFCTRLQESNRITYF